MKYKYNVYLDEQTSLCICICISWIIRQTLLTQKSIGSFPGYLDIHYKSLNGIYKVRGTKYGFYKLLPTYNALFNGMQLCLLLSSLLCCAAVLLRHFYFIRSRKKDKLRYRYPRGESYLDVIQRLKIFSSG